MSKRPEPTYPHHPLLEDLPMMSDDEFDSFCADIKDSGRITEPCVLLDHKGKPHLLAGRHRDLAGQVVGIKPRYITFDAQRMGDPWDFVVSQNVRRGQSTTRKTIEAVLLLERAPKARHGDGSLREKLSKRLNVAEKYVAIGHTCYQKHRSLWRDMINGKLEIAQARNRLGHAKKKQQIETLRTNANVTIADCDLRLGDNVELMARMPSGSIRCIFADPPYNQAWKYRADPTGDNLNDDQYLALCESWMRECARLLTEDGSLFVVINDTWSDHFGLLLRKIALVRRPTFVWWETFSNYRSAENGPTCCTRYIHYFTKGDVPFFNNIELRDPSKRESVYNDSRQSGIGKVPDNVWPISRVNDNDNGRAPGQLKGDAPQLPRSVPERCILLASEPGDTVLDPFNGWGMTGIAAITNQRKYIGLDRDAQGLEQARAWIAHEIDRLTREKKCPQ